MGALVNVVKIIVSIGIGIGIAYFWSTLRPDDEFNILLGVGIIGAAASFVTLYFMGKGQG
ncbi:MAG: hypothetical protein WC501_01340 [Candidatus Micrarchaeia archaeon]